VLKIEKIRFLKMQLTDKYQIKIKYRNYVALTQLESNFINSVAETSCMAATSF
jgi:uncharacterized protein (DUF2344 family)